MSAMVPGGTFDRMASISAFDSRKLAGDQLSNFADNSRTAASPRALTSSKIVSTVWRTLRSMASVTSRLIRRLTIFPDGQGIQIETDPQGDSLAQFACPGELKRRFPVELKSERGHR